MLKRGLIIGAAVTAIAGSTAAAASAENLYVKAKGGNNANPCTRTAPCSTILFVLGKARSGDTIFVQGGTYRQDVIIKKRVRLLGVGRPVLNLKGRNNNGFDFSGRKAAGSVVSGFVVEGAAFEGIVAEKTSHITISDNLVRGNDQGAKAKEPQGECAGQGEVPGDCGEGIHLIGVTRSTVTRNEVASNLGGILLSDETGPTAHNTISNNFVHGNVADCGITIVGHNPKATRAGKPAPKVAGVYGNLITGNRVNGNGTKGQGGGILMAVGAPGGAVYNNVIKGNSATGNGLAGITIHNHFFGPGAPAADTNGNQILDNKLTHNGVADNSEAEFGAAFAKGATVGILVGSGHVKLTGITISGNTISNSHFGIYTKNDANKVNPKKNSFHKVAVKVKQA